MAATAMTKWKDSLVVGSSKDGRSRWHYQESVVFLNLKNTCRGAGLGNNPYRDGSYKYYLSEPVVTNDAHGLVRFY